MMTAAEPPEPTEPPVSFPIVGIGASAGGLAAFEAFFSALPGDILPGMAFVLVQHLSPDHKSLLADLIRRYTHLPVFEIEDGMPVQINCIYIITPGHDLALLNGSLHLMETPAARGLHLPIDSFFRSLALDQREHSVAIVLSGTGSDGSLGVRAIKDAGGMVMVQTPASAEFGGMPHSAIATGVVDFECAASDLAAQLLTYVQHAYRTLPPQASPPAPFNEGAMKKIFILLRAQTRHDFSQYKPGTIQRRIERRMAVHQIDNVDRYVKFLHQNPVEVEALFRDLLIGVTSFFRDPDAFAALEEQVIPQLFVGKSTVNGVVRVWVAGCSTGEEAYSIAILLQERMEALHQSYIVQIFATDIDSRAIATARIGLYPIGIAADVSPLRLSRFFSTEPHGAGYRVHKGIRDMLVFSEHDLIKDPPFSRLDLISCRNLLIYLGSELQKRLTPLFHYALNPQGKLFLGSSEGVGEYTDLFTILDRKSKLYERNNTQGATIAGLPARYLPALSALDAALPRGSGKQAFAAPLPLRELTEQTLLAQVAPAAVLVTATGDILYLHGRTGMYLEPAPGTVGVANILNMAREGLRPPLASALHRCVVTQSAVRAPGLRVKTNGHFTWVNLGVHPVPLRVPGVADADGGSAGQPPLYLVILEDATDPVLQPEPGLAALAAPSADGATAQTKGASAALVAEAQARIVALTEELRVKDEYLRSTHEELESSNEELKSSNEEMQSVNEELQSTNEELETSKEELQSVNEELSTVNSELSVKVDDLSRFNNDMNNLLSGTGIATVFVDHQLRILRFTPAASQLINLIASDVGRPVGHIVSNLVGYTTLVADIQCVLDTLVPKDLPVQTNDGAWFTLRIRPYRTITNVIEGAVITFSDITETRRISDALLAANKLLRLAVVVRDAHDAITVQDLQGRTLAWNPAAVRMYGWSEEQALQMAASERMTLPARKEAEDQLERLRCGEVLPPYRTQRLTHSGDVVNVWVTATALIDETGQLYAIATTEHADDIPAP